MGKFKFKPFDQMTPEDYAEIGFMSGLEVHQQLLTESKLFCRCPAGHLHRDGYHSEILRHMRPTLSELGEYDGTALMEFKTKKNIIYRVHYDTVCTYDMDDTPPFMIDETALDISIEVGLLYGASITDELHIARKQYLDGSIPTGFQRTAITCIGGSVPYKDRQIGLIQMSIEEDSCRELSDIGHERVYLPDRLGTPLIETVTQPEMKTPQEIADVNNIIRRLARQTGKVRTGMGAGRQDVNVSVRGGTRIEIKGVSKINFIPRLAYHESMRQWNLLLLRDELHARGIDKDTFKADTFDVTHLLKKTIYPPLADAISRDWKVYCVNLHGYKDLLNWETQTDTYFSKEISDRVRVIACLTVLPNILHSDNSREKLTNTEWVKLKKFANATNDDTIVLVWGDDRDVVTGAKEIIIRAKEATIGIPSETRQALDDSTNGFERILPGPERMYPDTDLPPLTITKERLDRIKAQLPVPYWVREKWLKQLNVQADLVHELSVSKSFNLFEKAVKDYHISPKIATNILIGFPRRLKKNRLNIFILNEAIYLNIFELINNKSLVKDGIYSLMLKTCKKGAFDNNLILTTADNIEINRTIVECINEMTKIKIINSDKSDEVLMGLVMNKLRGRVNGSDIFNFINNRKQEA